MIFDSDKQRGQGALRLPSAVVCFRARLSHSSVCLPLILCCSARKQEEIKAKRAAKEAKVSGRAASPQWDSSESGVLTFAPRALLTPLSRCCLLLLFPEQKGSKKK